MQLSPELERQSEDALAKLIALAPLHMAHWQAAPERLMLQRALAVSPFIAHGLLCQPELISWLFEHKNEQYRAVNYQRDINEALCGCQDEAQLMRQLRQFRRQEMLWIAWQDIAQQLAITDSLTHLTALADALILGAYDWLYAACCRELGTPCDNAGTPQPMLILGMGKLGGGELNFSSDIDLIFCYPHNGETQGARRSIANAQFFTRLGQRLIKALDQQTADGFCYRVDMRLRPFGDSGPLAMSFGALEDYYQEQGRDWERYAMIKARVLGDEAAHGFYQELKQMLTPFVFRRYLDFGAIIALRRMKSMIQAEVRRRGLQDNIKLGAGGIRQIEFIVQVFQLMRGGREPSLRQRGLFVSLDAIEKLHLLTANEVTRLKQAYLLLRRVENLLQAIDDKQTQTLPQDALNQARLVLMMQAPSWQALAAEIAEHMQAVHEIFVAIIGDEPEGEQPANCEFYELWQGIKDPELARVMINEHQPQQAQAVYQSLVGLKQELTKRTLGQRGREVLNQLIPTLLAQIIKRDDCVAVFERVFNLIVTIATRTTYLELLNTHHHAITQLVNLCALSPLVAGQLAQFPILLDELLDSDLLYQPTAFTEYRHQLLEFVARIPEQDMEQQMEIIRQFKQTQLLKIAAADIGGNLALMRVSDHLTYLAEAIIDAVVNQAWLQMSAKYGTPSHLNQRDGRGFAVIGYGKLGGIELGYGSDLDLVFLHDCPADSYTTGEKQIDGQQFYLRLVQRIIHLFSTRTATGVLYEIDTRLRPSGASGLLVTTLDAFADYQQQQAWVWEHQALVRARVIYGDDRLTAGFNQVRQKILTLVRDKQNLAQEVIAMREKMRQHLLTHKADMFDLKQGIGGITDLEFMVQYWVLAYSHEHQNLIAWPDNIRILEQIAVANIITHTEAQALIDAYICLRNQIHHLALRGEPAQIAENDMAAFALARSAIMQMWQQKLASLLPPQA